MFKKCPCCEYEWKDLESFVSDKTLELHGYQANFNDPLAGLLLFTHKKGNCQSTMSVPVSKFAPVVQHQLQVEHFMPGLGPCPKFCLEPTNLNPCPNTNCPGHRIRELLVCVRSKLNSRKL